MAHMRLFAGLRETAGTGQVEVEASTVGEAVAALSARFGPDFAAAVPRARIWVNGDEAEMESVVGDDDEIALLPPVSGGAMAHRGASPSPAALAGAVAILVVVLANMTGSTAWWSAVAVGLLGLWVLDISSVMANRGRDLPAGPVLVSILVTMALTHLLGAPGVALGLVGSIIVSMGWAVASDSSRLLTIVAPMTLVALMASAALGSVMSINALPVSGVDRTWVLLAVAIVGSVASSLTARVSASPLGDPGIAGGLAAFAAALLAAWLFGQDVVTYLLVGLVLALSLLAGRGLGSVIRTREVGLIQTPPGLLAFLDGPVLAAAVYLPLVRLLG